jgi:hypothetical protein
MAMRSSIVLLLGPVAAAMLARPRAAATFGELLAWCAPDDKGGDLTLCDGYLGAGLELLASPDPMSNGGTSACVPAGEDRGRIIGLERNRAHAGAGSEGVRSTA